MNTPMTLEETPVVPEWVTETPAQNEYNLRMWESEGGPVQEVEINRAEYLALKAHLAAMRGYNAPQTAEDAVKAISALEIEGYSLWDEQQAARHLQTARDFYRAVPHLVVFPSKQFDEELDGLTE